MMYGATRKSSSLLLCLTYILYMSTESFAKIVPLRYQEITQGSRVVGGSAQDVQPFQRPSVLDVIEVDVPVNIPARNSCNVTMMEYSFANSYGSPFVGNYVPPKCNFNRVVLNFTVLARGRQFDRLATMYLNDTEIWRTSTAEPTLNGIVWTYHKDVSNYLSLFRQPQKVIFDLGNIVNDVYTSPFNTTLIATFYDSDDSSDPADLIIPVSARRSSKNQGSAWSIPESTAVDKVSIPRNAKRAIFTVSACGQATEEFWWGNVLSSTTTTFPNNTLYGYSTFREVQLLIDGALVGVAWPFPVIFTGGVVPSFWRPLVGIDSYDLREDEIDITPWLPLLSDGKSHTYEIRVVGIDDDGKGHGSLTPVGNYWVVSGKLFLWLDDDEDSVTTGASIIQSAPAPDLKWSFAVTQSPLGRNQTLGYEVYAARHLSFTSEVITSAGTRHVTWTQSLTYSNKGNLTAGGYNQTNIQSTTGVDMSSNGYSRRFSYPLRVDQSFAQDSASSAFNITGTMNRGKDVQVVGPSVFPTGLEQFAPSERGFDGARLVTRQTGEAGWIAATDPKFTRAWATTEQEFEFRGLYAEYAGGRVEPVVSGAEGLYRRHVKATNGSIVLDTNPASQNVGVSQVGMQSSGEDEEDEDEDEDEVDEDVRSFASTRIATLLGEAGAEAVGPVLDDSR